MDLHEPWAYDFAHQSREEAQMDLSGRSVLITGAANGLGRAFAERLAADGAGVGILDVDATRAGGLASSIQAGGGTAVAVTADVTDRAAVTRAVAEVAAALGGLHGLVNNAGIIHVTRCPFDEIPVAEWDRVFDVNVKGTWNTSAAAVPFLKAAGGGAIVNLSSSMALKGGPQRAHYVASKGAIIALTRVMAKELGDSWIRVNAVCPGSTLTEADPSPETLAQREKAASLRALKRMEHPRDVVGAVSFLLGDDSSFITGQNLVVEGGGILT